MEYVEKKSESNERHILQLDRRVTEVEKLGEDTSALWKQLGELQEYANNSRADLQSIRTYSFDLFSNTKKKTQREKNCMTFSTILFTSVAIFQRLKFNFACT